MASEISTYLIDSPGYLLNRSAKKIREDILSALAPTGLTGQEFLLLKVISAEGALPQNAVAARCSLDPTLVTQIADILEQRGFLSREPHPTDRRTKLLRLTPVGRRLVTRASKAVTKAQQSFLDTVTEQDWQVIRQALQKFLGLT